MSDKASDSKRTKSAHKKANYRKTVDKKGNEIRVKADDYQPLRRWVQGQLIQNTAPEYMKRWAERKNIG